MLGTPAIAVSVAATVVAAVSTAGPGIPGNEQDSTARLEAKRTIPKLIERRLISPSATTPLSPRPIGPRASSDYRS
jgi:hypothetical protein